MSVWQFQSQDFVAVLDDDAAVRESICLMLRDLKIPVIDYADAQSFLDDPLRRRCVCLIVDLRLPAMSGIELQRRLNLDGSKVPIIFVSGYGDVSVAVEAMREGATDFLQKPLKPQALLDRVQNCLQLVEQRNIEMREVGAVQARLECLTPREREVFDLIIEGRRSKQIADVMGLTLKTVEEYRSKVLHKMHVTSTPELLSQVAPILNIPGAQPAPRG